MKLVTGAQMRAIDAAVIKEVGLPGMVLMENAGLRVVESIAQRFPSLDYLRVTVLAGKGNNGGDGLVIARHLFQRGARVQVFLSAPREAFQGDAAANLRVLEQMPVSLETAKTTDDIRHVAQHLAASDLAVDALLGTGLSGQVRGVTAKLIRALNEAECPVVAVDIPSGIDADDGQCLGTCVRADWTVTLGLPKYGVVLHPGAEYAGEVTVGDLSLASAFLEKHRLSGNLTTPDLVQSWLPDRPATAHKGNFGRVLIVGGSSGMAGAVILAARAALRGGCGLCTVALPDSINLAAKSAAVEATTVPLPETADRSIAEHAFEIIERSTQHMNVVAVGPGLTRNPETASFARRLVEHSGVPVVIDADAIAAWTGRRAELKRVKSAKILTPHTGEMSELMGLRPASVERDRISTALRCAVECEAFVVLKGARTIIASPSGEVFVNPTGNAGMATGGTGDVLTGLIASLVAQGLAPLQAAAAGTYLHGRAGDLARDRHGEAGLIASDVVDCLPKAMTGLARDHEERKVGAGLYQISECGLRIAE